MARRRTNSISRDFRLRCVSQSSPSSTFSMPSQMRASPLCSCQSRAQMPVVKPEHLRRQPRRNVHAVRDVSDRHRVFGSPRKKPVHMARDTSPCSDETALARRESFRPSTVMQNCHDDGCRVLRCPAPSGARAKCPSASRSGPRCSSIRSAPKRSWPGGHRRVRGENHFARTRRHGLIEADAFVLHAAANRFQHRESAVAFVHVIDARA